MKAELIAVGSELLRLGRRDTNGDWIATRLERVGIGVAARVQIVDDTERLAACLRDAVRRSDLVLVSGGLGPTEDDRTRDALALAVDRPLVRDEERLAMLRRLFEERGRRFQPVQARQAGIPEGGTWIENPVGTAPGIELATGKARVFALPGVPAELKAMFRDHVEPRIAGLSRAVSASRTLKVGGRFEASVDAQLRDLYELPGIDATILAGREGIEVHLRAEAATRDEAIARLGEAERRISERLGNDVYGRDDASLPAVTGELLARRHRTVATAESCTAGLIAATLTDVPGSSAWFRGGIVVYSDDLKSSLAGVRPETLAAHGAVSEPVARELAEGAARRCGADFGIGVTGVAGPSGGTACKPVGLVHLALAGPGGVEHWRTQQFGDRKLVRRRTVNAALDRLRRRLLSEEGP